LTTFQKILKKHWIADAKRRIIVEHILSRMKKYKILSDAYRSKEKEYNQHIKNIAALCNFRLLFKELHP